MVQTSSAKMITFTKPREPFQRKRKMHFLSLVSVVSLGFVFALSFGRRLLRGTVVVVVVAVVVVVVVRRIRRHVFSRRTEPVVFLRTSEAHDLLAVVRPGIPTLCPLAL